MATATQHSINANGFRLDPEAKAKWLTALRSGDYTQGRGTLKGSEGYCCLGVYAEAQMGLTATQHQYEDGTSFFTFSNNGLNMSTFVPEVEIPLYVQSQLAQLNDQYKLTFAEIADHIEKYL